MYLIEKGIPKSHTRMHLSSDVVTNLLQTRGRVRREGSKCHLAIAATWTAAISQACEHRGGPSDTHARTHRLSSTNVTVLTAAWCWSYCCTISPVFMSHW